VGGWALEVSRVDGGAAAAPELILDPAAQELLAAEVEGLLAAARDPRMRERFTVLGQAVAAGTVPESCLPALEQLLVLGVETGRIERVHGRAADTLARGLFLRTPTGRAQAEQAAAVSRALEALAGAVVRRVVVVADGPGAYRLGIESERGEALLRIDRSGVRLDALTVGA
jgi:hypothetical protein